jgi:hypothetical protein
VVAHQQGLATVPTGKQDVQVVVVVAELQLLRLGVGTFGLNLGELWNSGSPQRRIGVQRNSLGTVNASRVSSTDSIGVKAKPEEAAAPALVPAAAAVSDQSEGTAVPAASAPAPRSTFRRLS